MPNVLTPNAKQQFFDNNGKPLAGGKLFTYAAGTSTKLATTVSAAGANNANPIILNYRGEADVWIPPNVSFKFVLSPGSDTDPPTAPIWTVDAIVNSQLITLYGGVDTGSANAYLLTFTANFAAYTDGIVIYWIPSNSNTGASTVNVNGLGAISVVNADGSALSANSIQANVPTTILYKSGAFVLVTSLSSTNTGGTFPATVFGCTTAPVLTVTWAKSGRIVSLVIPATGVLASNGTSFGVSGLPTNLRLGVGATSVAVYGILAVDNSVTTYAAGDAFISASSGNINFEWKGGTWTAAGNKFFGGFVFTYPVASNFT